MRGMNERNKPHICKNCVHSIIYCELDENMELNNEKQFHVCMLTDTDVESEDTCTDFEIHCDTCLHDGKQSSNISMCDVCVDGSEYTPNTDKLCIEL